VWGFANLTEIPNGVHERDGSCAAMMTSTVERRLHFKDGF